MNVAATTEVRSRGTIVVAEDDIATRMLLCQVLTRERFRVIAVDNGRLACDAVRREHPDVVLLDWRMPVMDGREALQELKADKETRGIPIVMLTSLSQVDERIMALESGVQDFLSKPFDPRELVACIEQQLRWQQGLALDARAAFLEERNALLAASERRYRLLAEAMPHMVWMAEPDGRISYVNRAWSQYTGALPDRNVSDGWSLPLHPDDRESALAAWTHSLQTGEPFEIQCRFKRAVDGTYRWHLGRAIPTRDSDGTIVEWVGSCADIHDYKIADETRAILDTIGSMISIRTAAGFVDYTGPYWSQYTGAHAQAGLGQQWRDFVHPDDVLKIDRARAEIAASTEYEMRIRGSDGSYRWFLARSTMLPHADGSPRRWLDTATDVDDLKRAQSALESSETRYRVLTDSMPQIVWVIDADGRFEYVNARWSDYTGLTLEATRSRGPTAIVRVEDCATIAPPAGTGAREYTAEARLVRHDGLVRWHSVHAVPFRDAVDNRQKWIGTATDVEDSKVAALRLASTAAELEHLAHHDTVTNLPNRTLLVERLAAAIALAQRNRTGVMVLYLDLDRFKAINDSFGHAAGDVVLAVTAKRISEALRAGDTASRVGGDEFILVCATSDGAPDAVRLAGRLKAAITQPIQVHGQTVGVGVSIGISLYPTDGRSGDELIERADSAMYAAKQSGRNGFRLYSPVAHSSSIALLDLEAELREAIAAKRIVVRYRLIRSIDTARPIGAAAVILCDHPSRGIMSAESFLPLAETHRLLGAITGLVFESVCAQIANWTPVVDADFRVSIDISAAQLSDAGFVDALRSAVRTYRIDPRRVEIQLSERTVIGRWESVRATLAELRALGIRLAIADFGSGYTSLASIAQRPLGSVKLERSVVDEIVAAGPGSDAAQTIVALGHRLGERVTADIAESGAAHDAFSHLGAGGFAGYLAGQAVTAEAFAELLARR